MVAALCLLGMNMASAEVVVVVAAGNPVVSLSKTELADIFLGKASRLRGSEPVVPVDQRERSAAHDYFYREHLDLSPSELKAYWSRLIFTGRGQPPKSVRDDAAMADVIAANPDAIGYIDPSLVDERLRVVAIE